MIIYSKPPSSRSWDQAAVFLMLTVPIAVIIVFAPWVFAFAFSILLYCYFAVEVPRQPCEYPKFGINSWNFWKRVRQR